MTALRLGLAPVLVLIGAVSGAAGVLVHARWWGLVLAAAAVVAAMLALPAGWWSRPAFALGWVAALGYALMPRGEGDFLLASSIGSYLFLATGLIVAVWAVATLPRPSRHRSSRHDDLREVGSSS